MPVEFVPPVGLLFDDPPALPQEGYEVHWRADEDPPHYFFFVQTSSLRTERLFRDAFEGLPDFCHAVLEVRRSDEEMDADPDGPTQVRWVSDLLHRADVLAVLDRYRFQIFQDGMVGFGAYDPDNPREVFVDDHKLLNLFSPALDLFEGLLHRHGVPARPHIETLVEVPHEHHTLTGVPDVRSTPVDAHLRRRVLDVRWFAEAIRRRLGMRLSPIESGS